MTTLQTIEPLADDELYRELESVRFQLDEAPWDDRAAAVALTVLGHEARAVAEAMRAEREERAAA